MTEPTIKEQLEIENQMVAFGVSRQRLKVARAQNKNRGADLEHAQRMMHSLIEPVAEAIKEFTTKRGAGSLGKFRKMISSVPPEVAAYMTMKAIFNHFADGKSLAALGSHIGMMLEDEGKFGLFQSKYKDYYDTIIADFQKKGTTSYRHKHRVLTKKANERNVGWQDWLPSERVQVGVKLLDLVMSSTTLIEKKTERIKNKTHVSIVPTEECLEWIRKFENHMELLNPDRKPTIIPPDDWVSYNQGGYYSPRLRKNTPLIKSRISKAKQEELFSTGLEKVQAAVNILQRTAWRINKPVLDVMREVWSKSLPIGLPQSEPYPIPVSPVIGTAKEDMTEEQKEIFDGWKAEARTIHTMNKERVSKCFQVIRVLNLATEYKQYDKFWYVYQCDFRGRIYSAVSGLSPQGPDFAKSLLHFGVGKKLGRQGEFWFLVHGANTFGVDKVSYNERVRFIRDQHDFIIRAAADPINNSDFWGNADKPWQFLAFCFEYAEYVKTGEEHISHLPIGLDGSCNGLQNFSAMLRDEVGGSATNLTPGDKPADIYQRVGDVLYRKLGHLSDPDAPSAVLWRTFAEAKGGIPRGLPKRPVMTLPYGSTQQSCKEYIYRYIVEEAPEFFPPETRWKAAMWLTPLMWESIGDVVIAARAAMDWIQQVASKLAKENKPLYWTTPIGFPVYQDRKRQELKQFTTQLAGRFAIALKVDLPQIDVNKQKLGSSPNFIHSMDACHQMLMLLDADAAGITSFACIHDDFGTHAADIQKLHKSIRTSFVNLYTDHDPLEAFKSQIEEFSGIQIPHVPAKGLLNINNVLVSDYFFG